MSGRRCKFLRKLFTEQIGRPPAKRPYSEWRLAKKGWKRRVRV